MRLDTSFAWVTTLFIVGALIYDLRNDIRRLLRGRNIVLAGIFSWYLFEGITLSPGLQEFDQATYNYAIFCVMLSAVAFLLGYHGLRPSTKADSIAACFRQLDNSEVLWRLVLFSAVVGFAPILFYSGLQLSELFEGIVGMRKTWGGLIGRGRYGGFRDAVLMLEYFINGASPLAVILVLDRKVSRSRKVVCCLVMLWPVLRAFGSGTRSPILTALLPMAAVVYFKVNPRLQKLLLVGSLLCVPTIYYLMAAIVATRNSGDFDWEAGTNVDYVGNEMLQELAFITKKFPQPNEYQWGNSYYVQLVNPIPRFLWPSKPTLDSGLLLAELKGAVDATGEPTMTNSPGLIGEMYLNFGLMGIFLLSGFGGWLTRGWDRLVDRNSDSLCTMIFFMMGLGTLYILGRSFTMGMFYGMLFLYCAVWIVTRLAGHRTPVAMQ